jgi:hypothetical protein
MESNQSRTARSKLTTALHMLLRIQFIRENCQRDNMHRVQSKGSKTPNATASSHGTSVKSNYELFFCLCMQAIIKSLQDICSMNKLCVHGKGYIVSRLHRLHTTASCAASTHRLAARALPQPCRAPRLLVTRVHGIYVNFVVRREYSSPGRSGST